MAAQKRDKSAKGKPRGRPFTGKDDPRSNAGGRPKVAAEFRARARTAVDEHVLTAWIAEVVEQGPEWVRCSEMLAAYGYGKPSQGVEVSGPAGEALVIHVNKVASASDCESP